MTPRGFDRYMVAIGMGTHPKLARLTDSEFRAHVVGVLAVAAMSPVRGYLLVGSLPAEAIDVAAVARVPERVAASAMRKLMDVGVLVPDEEHGCLRVHDWDDVNPSPGAERTRRWRDGNASPTRHASVTQASQERHANVTEPSPEVKKLEVEGTETTSQYSQSARADVMECFAYWQEKCSHPQAILTPKRKRAIEGRLREGYSVAQIRTAIEKAALYAYVNEQGTRFDDIELICRSGEKLEGFVDRGAAGRVVPMRRGSSAGRSSTPEQRRRTHESQLRNLLRQGIDPRGLDHLAYVIADSGIDVDAELAAARERLEREAEERKRGVEGA